MDVEFKAISSDFHPALRVQVRCYVKARKSRKIKYDDENFFFFC